MPHSRKSRSAFPGVERGMGLTKREYAVIHILAGLLGHPDLDPEYHDVVNDAITIADDMFTRLGDPEWKRE